MSITIGTSAFTSINSGFQSLNSIGSLPLRSLGSVNGVLGSLGTSIGSVVTGSAGSIDLIPGITNGESVIGALAGSAPALVGNSAGLFIDSVSGLGTILGTSGAPVVGGLGSLATLGAGSLAGIGGILSMLMGALGLGTAIPASGMTTVPNSLIGLSQLFGG